MGLETSTFINGLSASWPTSGELKSQGDDHIRLIKGVLQNTFPNASKAFYFPSATVASAGQALAVTDQNKIIMLSTAGGELAVSLPALTVNEAGWSCEVMKSTPDANGITVSPPSGTIGSKVGATATVRVGVTCEPARFIWSGSAWYCSKPGLVGATVNFDGATLPAGHLVLDGTAFNATTFAELNAALGTNVLRDKRGRVEAGVDGGTNRILGTIPGGTIGLTGGAEFHVLVANEMPTHRHAALINDPGHFHLYDRPDGYSIKTGGTGTASPTTVTASNTDTKATGIRITNVDGGGLDNTGATGGGLGHMNLQPTIVTNKLIRAC
jgi:microcystin-dependent protein